MPDPTTDLTHRVARLEWHVMALTIACLVLAIVAGTALALPFVGLDAPADGATVAAFTADTIESTPCTPGF